MRLVSRTLDVMELLAEHADGLGVVRIGAELGEAPSSVHRLLAVLNRRGYVMQEPTTKRYRLGNAVLRLSQAYQQRSRLISAAMPHLERLSATTLESVFLSELTGDHVICVASAESPRPLSFFMRLGARTPFHAASSARAILAFQPTERQEALLQGERMIRFTEFTPVDLSAALAEIDRTVRRGYAVCDQEIERGIRALSAPIATSQGHVGASITLVAPQDRLPLDHEQATVEMLTQAANEISIDMGVTPFATGRSTGLTA